MQTKPTLRPATTLSALLCIIIGVGLLLACEKEGQTDVRTAYSRVASAIEIDNQDVITFLHISDTHSSDVTSNKMTRLLNADTSLDFAILSGDVMGTPAMLSDFAACQRPIYIVPGNHDAYDDGGQHHFRQTTMTAMPIQQGIHWGNNRANYYYVDYHKRGHTLRIICLDQYETDVVGPNLDGGIVMSQTQINWLCRLLEHSDTADAVMIQMHCGYGNRQIGARDVTHANAFISILAPYYDNTYDYHSLGHPLMIPEIVNAYLTGHNINGRRYCTGIRGDSLTVDTHFTHPADNFIGHFGGHLHWDLVEHLPDYPQQLQVLMTFCGWLNGECPYNDNVKTSTGDNSYNINLNIIDFKRRQLTIKRIGANRIINGSTRDSIQFSFR